MWPKAFRASEMPNGASDLINSVFAVRGLHTRMIYTNPVMPLDCVTLVVLYAEIANE